MCICVLGCPHVCCILHEWQQSSTSAPTSSCSRQTAHHLKSSINVYTDFINTVLLECSLTAVLVCVINQLDLTFAYCCRLCSCTDLGWDLELRQMSMSTNPALLTCWPVILWLWNPTHNDRLWPKYYFLLGKCLETTSLQPTFGTRPTSLESLS